MGTIRRAVIQLKHELAIAAICFLERDLEVVRKPWTRSGTSFWSFVSAPGRVAVRRSDFPWIQSLDTNFETAWIRCAQADESAYRN
jgi:hypothetical protein